MPCKRRACPSYAYLWAYDWRIVRLEDLIGCGGKAVMYTLTPPGANVLPFDGSRCSHSPHLRCSGTRGCVVVRAPFGESTYHRTNSTWLPVQAARSAFLKPHTASVPYIFARFQTPAYRPTE
jgi:hypothetical protein